MVAQHREPFDRPEAQCLVATARIELQRAERFGRLHAAIAERTESPKGHKPRFAAALNLPLEFFHARSRLPEVIGRKIDLDRCDAHPRIVGIERLEDRKSTRLNSSHTVISYAVFCLKKKNTKQY